MQQALWWVGLIIEIVRTIFEVLCIGIILAAARAGASEMHKEEILKKCALDHRQHAVGGKETDRI